MNIIHLGCVPLGWSRSGSVMRDHSDHGRSNTPMNPLWTRIHWFIWSSMIQMISDHWSWSGSSERNAPLRETKWFPEGPVIIKCFVIFLDIHFNSNKRITEASQNSQLGTYKNKFNSQNHLMNDYKVPSLHYLHLFPPIAAVSLLG